MVEIISKTLDLRVPFITETPFPLLVCDNFITNQLCERLISEAEDHISSNNIVVHGGRSLLPWKSVLFNDLTSRSPTWRNFQDNMPKDAFSLFQEISKNKFSKSNTYNKWISKKDLSFTNDLYNISSKIFPKSMISSYKRSLELSCKTLPNNRLIAYGIIGLIDSFYRNMLSIYDLLSNKVPVTPLLDYSKANMGYTREIHRDSDSRAIVLLLYLNSLEDETEGGTLDIYGGFQSSGKYPPQVSHHDVNKILEIHPRQGRLVMFFNQSNSYHSVSKMSHSNKGRYFIYGGFTMQSSLDSPSLRCSTRKFATEYHLYK